MKTQYYLQKVPVDHIYNIQQHKSTTFKICTAVTTYDNIKYKEKEQQLTVVATGTGNYYKHSTTISALQEDRQRQRGS